MVDGQMHLAGLVVGGSDKERPVSGHRYAVHGALVLHQVSHQDPSGPPGRPIPCSTRAEGKSRQAGVDRRIHGAMDGAL